MRAEPKLPVQMIRPGEKIDTDFMVEVVERDRIAEVRFANLLDRPAIVSVYMRNNTSGCDLQNRSLAEEAEWFDRNGYNLIALSKDGCRSHLNYARKLGISYRLVSDPEHRFSRAAGAIVEKKMFGKSYRGPSRSAFVIAPDGTVRGVIEKIDTKNHAEELKELIRQLDRHDR